MCVTYLPFDMSYGFLSFEAPPFVCIYPHRLNDIAALTQPFNTMGQREGSTHPACAAAKNGWEAIPRGELKKEAAGGSALATLVGLSSSAHTRRQNMILTFAAL